MNGRSLTRYIALSAVTAALYAGLCLLVPAISFGPVQFRIAEALVLLPALWPETLPGLVLGCLLGNLSTGNIYDIVFGTLATLIAALLTEKLPGKLWLKALPPVLVNGIVIGLVLTFGYGIKYFFINFLTVTLGEAVAVYALGLPIIKILSVQKPGKL